MENVFTNFKDFKEEFIRREKATVRPLVNLHDLVIITQEDALKKPVAELAYPDYKDAVLYLLYDGKYYPLSDWGLRSLGLRVDWAGKSISNLDTKILVKALTDLFQKTTGNDSKVRLIIIDRVVHAVLSMDYKVLRILDSATALYEYSQKRFGKCNMENGFASYYNTNLWFKFCKATTADSPEIQQAAKDNEFVVDLPYNKTETWSRGLKFASSDTGNCSTSIKAAFFTQHGNIVFDNLSGNIQMIHKGENTLERFNEVLDTLFAKLHDRMAYVSKLVNIKVSNPEEVIESIASGENFHNKSIKLGKREVKVLMELWEEKLETLKKQYEEYTILCDDDEIEDFTISMYDILMLFIEFQNKCKPERKELVENMSGLIMVTDFSDVIQ